jgi:hypothetical protein
MTDPFIASALVSPRKPAIQESNNHEKFSSITIFFAKYVIHLKASMHFFRVGIDKNVASCTSDQIFTADQVFFANDFKAALCYSWQQIVGRPSRRVAGRELS